MPLALKSCGLVAVEAVRRSRARSAAKRLNGLAGAGLIGALLNAPVVHAADFDPLRVAAGQLLSLTRLLQGNDGFIIAPLEQGRFESLAGDVSAAVAMPAADAGLPPGHGRWRVSLGASRSATESPQLWQDSNGDRREALYAPQVLVEAGIGERIGVGVSYAQIPGNGARLYGVRGSLLAAGSAGSGPALALRASHHRLSGVDGLEAQATALDAVGSWGAGAWRPFVGAGVLRGHVAAEGGDLRYQADLTLPRVFGGIEYTLGALRLGAELGSTDGRTTQALRLSYSFD